jgi:hypothetical protein
MRWQAHKYQLWIVNTASESHLYLWSNWKHLFPWVDKLVSLSPTKAFIRSVQAIPHQNSRLGFGRMAWSRENNEKWTRQYRENESEKAGVSFYCTQIWAPDWNQFDRTGIPPDIFLQLYNYPSSQITREGLIIAIARSIAKENATTIEPAIAGISKFIPDSVVGKISRSWSPGSGFPNHIQDMNNWELQRVLEGRNEVSLAHRIRSIFKGRGD